MHHIKSRAFLLSSLILLSFACAMPGLREAPSSTPIPPDLPTTPTPVGGTVGGLTGLFQADQDQDSGNSDFFRLYEDGVVLWADNVSLGSETSVDVWLQFDNPAVIHGIYWTSADQIWMELPIPYLNNEVHLTDLRGKFCVDAIALQTMHRYAQLVPSVSDPVTKYTRLDTAVVDPSCHVAPFYFWITLPGNPGGTLDLVVQTIPGEVCTLTYHNPDKTTPLVENLSVTADEEGKCIWKVPLPVDTLPGTGQAAVTVAGVTKVVEVTIKE